MPGRPASWRGTNLDFSAVDPALYAGGFHDFDAGNGRDIAQTIQFDPGSLIVFQWNEPYDPAPPAVVGVIAEGKGSVPEGGDTTFTFNGEAGKIVEIFLDGDESGPGEANPDLTFAVFDPDGNFIQFVDNTTNPESLTLELPATGVYTVLVDSFTEDQSGDFLWRVSEVEVDQRVFSDYNLLFFLEDGTLHRRVRRAEPAHEPPARGGRPAGTAVADGDRARQRAAEEEQERRGPYPLRRLRWRAPAGTLQLHGAGDLRPQLVARRDGRRGLSVLPAVHPGVLHVAGAVHDLLRQEKQAPEDP